MYVYMKNDVPGMLHVHIAKGLETVNKQTQQTSNHNGLENIKATILAKKNNMYVHSVLL